MDACKHPTLAYVTIFDAQFFFLVIKKKQKTSVWRTFAVWARISA
jgi:hypothetical protein